jgi:hypothetical protein
VVLPGNEYPTTQYNAGRIDGGDSGNVKQLVGEPPHSGTAILHQKGSDLFMLMGERLRFKLQVEQPHIQVRKP